MSVMSDADWDRLVTPMIFKTDDCDCWFWGGHVSKQGYGLIDYIRDTTTYVHRLSLERKLGRAIAPNHFCLHSCVKTPNCVNPDHLTEGTPSMNQIDRFRDGTSKSKLTFAQVLAIRADTRKQIDISNDYNVSTVTISNIKLRKRWKHIP